MQNNTTIATISTVSKINETFVLAFCHLIDFPSNGVECSEDGNLCVHCTIHGTYFTGESVNNLRSSALMHYYTIWILIILLSIPGIFGNILVIMVFKRRMTDRSFDSLLMVLAMVDIFCCLSSVFASTGCSAYFGNWFGRGQFLLWYWYWLSTFGLFGRSCSTLMTALITVERFLMIAYPYKANGWFTSRNTKILAISILGFAMFLNYPRFASLKVEPNDLKEIPSLESLEYLLRPTSQGYFWYVTLDGLTDKIDNWIPLPIILTFNLMSLWKVDQLSKRRRQMNMEEKMNIRAVKMFLPVVVIYFVTNIEPVVNYLIIHFANVAYRELYMLLFLSIVVNSAVNFPIYYFSSYAFKKDTHFLIEKFRQNERKRERRHQKTGISSEGNRDESYTTGMVVASSSGICGVGDDILRSNETNV